MTSTSLTYWLACSALLVVAWSCGGQAIIDAGSGGALSTSSSSSSTGSSGTGGGGQCSTVADCPSPEPTCEAPACIGGQCQLVNQPGGVPCGDGSNGICDGAGNCLQLCQLLCDDLLYCVNPPGDDECVLECEAAFVTCSPAEAADLFECHLDFSLDCDKLIELTECLDAVPCLES